MPDDYTLKVSFLGGFLVIVAFFAIRYFSLNNDPGVRPFPRYVRHTQTMIRFPALWDPDCRVL